MSARPGLLTRPHVAGAGSGRQNADMTAPDPRLRGYEELLAEARTLYPGIRIGRPGRARTYWATIAVMRVLRLGLDVDVEGAQEVAKGPAILLANHVHALDPVVVAMSTWVRVSAFTKVEWFEHRGALFFRLMGQIPLRRGDAAATEWAMQMSRHALADGGRIGLYPEGTRSPEPTQLHRLHKRVLIPLLQANPDVPVHALTTQYERRPRRRTRVRLRISGRLPLDPRTMTADELTAGIRDALLQLGGQEYVDRYARDVKAERRAAAEAGLA